MGLERKRDNMNYDKIYIQNSTEEVQGDGVALYEGFGRIKVQPSSHIIAWRVIEDKIASKENFERRETSMVNNICSMCGEEEEKMYHLFFTCRVAWLVWSKCYEWVGLTSINHWEPKRNFLHFKMSNVNEVVN